MLKWASSRPGRTLAVAAILSAALIYAWQVVRTWQTDIDQSRAGTSVDFRISYSRGALEGVSLKGMNIATGASATLQFNGRDAIGRLNLQDMPILPDSYVYQLWCLDSDGTVDPSSVFRVPIDTEGNMTVIVSAPRMLYAYDHFRITIQSIRGSGVMSGVAVMEH